MKTCCKCHVPKPFSSYFKDSSRKDGYYHTCKECYSATRYPNKIKRKATRPGYKYCYKCKTEKPVSEFSPAKSKYDGLSHSCRQCYNQHRRPYIKNKYRTDSSCRIKRLLRKRLSDAVMRGYKAKPTLELLGCTIEELKAHLQQTAIKNGYLDFDIETYDSSKYHIDHIVPCNAFELECSYHQLLCFNWSNLQVLPARENISKSDKVVSNFLP